MTTTQTISRELLEKAIADWEAARDEIPFGLDEEDNNTLAALKYALMAIVSQPVAVPDVATPQSMRAMFCQLDDSECAIAADVWNACRAAMLKGDKS